MSRVAGRGGTLDLLGRVFLVGVLGLFFLNLFAAMATVVTSSFAATWFGGWLPSGFETKWYAYADREFGMADVLRFTALVTLAVATLACVLGVPAAYVLARASFRGKRALLALFLLPMLTPPLAYGVPLAAQLYRTQLAATFAGVVLINLVPALPFVILVMTPFIEQLDPNLESAARMLGARPLQVFRLVLLPLIVPGILTAALLVVVRTMGMFELTFLVSGADTQTLVVALYTALSGAGIRPQQSIDAMAVVYMLTTLTMLVVALRFVSPTQMVFRVRE
ncbi:ABC transporter permease subunit [soil metagenome]